MEENARKALRGNLSSGVRGGCVSKVLEFINGRRAVILLQALAVGLGLGATAFWASYNPRATLDYGSFEGVLRACVRDDSVDAAALRAEESELRAFLRRAMRVSEESLSGDERTAFGINKFNACALWAALSGESNVLMDDYQRHYVGASRLRGRAKAFHAGGEYEYPVHMRIKAMASGDSRICFALSYGVGGGPRLRAEAYRAETLHQQLEDQIRRFFSNPQNFRLDRGEGVLYLSMAFKDVPGAPGSLKSVPLGVRTDWRPRKWYGGRFKATSTERKPLELDPSADLTPADLANEAGSFLNFLMRYCSGEDKEHLAQNSVRVTYVEYNWDGTK